MNQFQSVLEPVKDRGVYLAGNAVSWHGGWIEGALQTSINAVSAVLHRLEATFHTADTPLQLDGEALKY